MTRLFLSYRRDESAALAGRIHDRLVTEFGAENIFFDVDSIPFGEDFREHIASMVRQCDAMLVLIGQNWTTVACVPFLSVGRRLAFPHAALSASSRRMTSGSRSIAIRSARAGASGVLRRCSQSRSVEMGR